MKGIIGILTIALLGMVVGGVIGIRESAAQAFQPEWYTPIFSWVYVGLNVSALVALIRFAQGWEAKALLFFCLVAGWFFPAMVVGFGDGSEWMPHVVWALMLLVSISVLMELILRKRQSQTPAYKH
jgi:hypothetical protein